MAAKRGLIGFSCTNSEAIMVPTFARKAMIGSNPIAVAAPADPHPFFFDASTTVVTRGKLEMYNKTGKLIQIAAAKLEQGKIVGWYVTFVNPGKPLPEGWALDENGAPCSEAPRVLANIVGKKGGGIVPLGGSSEMLGSHKGYGWGMVAELFSSILSLGTTSDLCCTFPDKTGICHGFAAIDPAIFGDAAAIKAHFSEYLQRLRDAPKAVGRDRIYTHGEKEVAAAADRRKNGVPVNDGTMVELLDLCNYLKLDFSAYFPGYTPPSKLAGFEGNY